MAKRDPFDKAQTYNLSRAEVIILFKVAAWFNGMTFEVHDHQCSISTDYEPTLRQLCGEHWEPGFDEAHDRLIQRELFKSENRGENVYIAGRRCRWAPTENCMQIIEHIFSDQEKIYPDWVLDEHTRPPTFRDGSELLQHRKGVLASKHLFGGLERVSGVDVYPRINLPQRPDLRLFGHGEQLARVEVLSNHRNTDTWENKFTKWRSEKAGPTVWIFENRENMVRFWNHLISCGLIDLDGGRFGGRVKNWSPRRVNDRLRRSREGTPNYDSHDVVWTIPGVVGGGRIDAFELFKDNRITFRS
ncbi:hypothetical protein GJ633_00360 [Halorubrum sp. CBA1125]|uniref:hypothetical protein n=1 Tax=Halorubrum sp. CBA1125 TaxID=2668072 RepID=UPI0012E71D94|nr:hypothetical protein [Halorubrum sp. CBA1125]MUW13269.1 hypothetical protein [Halorubrum sp. CBA1125]